VLEKGIFLSEIKEQLIQIATETIQKNGVHGLTIRNLGEEVGIKSSSVMYRFKNKDGLMLEVVKNYNHFFFSHLENIDNTFTNPIEKLEELISTLENLLEKERLCLCAMLACEHESLDIETKKETLLFFTTLEKWLEKNVLELSLDKNLALVIVSSIEGAMLIDKLEKRNVRLKSIKQWIKTF